ncbi:MAG TPA: efflux RND transporter permease subunit, partial [Candidatus Angelobacter sp.]
MAHKSDQELINGPHNTARFFVENKHIAWVALIATAIWGAFAYFSMPQRKDPEIPVRIAVAMVLWPGESAERVEQLITMRMEEKIAGNRNVTKIESISRTGLAVTYVELGEDTRDTQKEFDDINFRLNSIHDLPQGASPIQFIKDFGDTSALMLTVASPKVSGPELQLRIRDTREAVERVRAERKENQGLHVISVIQHFPRSMDPELVRPHFRLFLQQTAGLGAFRDFRFYNGSGFAGADFLTTLTADQVSAAIDKFKAENLHQAEFHPDAWPTVVVGDISELEGKLTAAAGDKYTYRELEDLTEQMQKTLEAVPIVSKVERSGILPERVLLTFSQEKLAAYNLPANLDQLLSARNTNAPGGEMIAGGRRINIEPSGEFHSEKELSDLMVTMSQNGTPVYLRDLVDIVREYETPSRFLNYYTSRDAKGQWHRNRAITLALQMRSGEQIGNFGKAVDAALADLRTRMPADLIVSRTSDQPLQVREQIGLFMNSLMEAVVLVVIISWIGFWEWRSALVMALSIPLTLAMTFGMMHLMGIDIQQVSIASLIIALGLLVDDPVVAGDSIKRSLAAGHPPVTAAWLGPTKLATAIVFATLTNIVAYLPFMWLTGDPGKFLYSLAIVLTCSLVASRIVSMTFIPLLGYYLLKPKAEPEMAERRKKGFAAIYYKVGDWAIAHRWKVMMASLLFLLLGGVFASRLKTQFFPKDYSYLSYVDVWLPNDAPLVESNQAAAKAEAVMRRVAEEYGREGGAEHGKPHEILKSLTTFVGGGGPRFWFTVSPELQQLNYAQIIIQVNDK